MLTLILTLAFICLLILIVTIWSDYEQRRALKFATKVDGNSQGAEPLSAPLWTKIYFFRLSPTALAPHQAKTAD
jgi:hypothetical protein